MSTDTHIKLSGEHGAAVTSHVQYGIRFPDGSTAWDVIPGTSIDISAIADINHRTHHSHAEAWEREAVNRAKGARMDVAEYGAAHTFIKRTVIVAVTDTEDMTRPAPVSAPPAPRAPWGQ